MNTKNSHLTHERTFNIVWGDMDALGHVNNARYFDYFQEGRIEWLASMELSMTEDKGPVLIQVGCTFLLPVIYPARLTLISRAHSPGRSSIRMAHELYQKDQLMAQGDSKIVWVDYKKNVSIPIPEKLRKLFDAAQGE